MRADPLPAVSLLTLLLGSCRAEPREPFQGEHALSSACDDRVGLDCLGNDLTGRLPDAWEVPPGGKTESKATLVRYWTDGCSYCRFTLPAIEELRARYRARGLETVAVYHPKRPRPPSREEVESAARAMGYHGPLAADLDWKSLNDVWLGKGGRPATSVTFLLDARGIVRWVHPGPEFHPSEDPAHGRCVEDYDRMRREIEALLLD